MKINIKNLKAKTLLGVYEEERKAQREVTLNLTIDFDHKQAVASDDVKDTIDYAVIEQTIVDGLSRQKFALLESLAAYVTKQVMGFAGVREVTVAIDKPGALKHADSVAIIHSESQ
ncbi:MAG: dihydroneopterin aldolase [Rickettsiales bacterium]